MSLHVARIAAINAGHTPGSTGFWAFIKMYAMSNK